MATRRTTVSGASMSGAVNVKEDGAAVRTVLDETSIDMPVVLDDSGDGVPWWYGLAMEAEDARVLLRLVTGLEGAVGRVGPVAECAEQAPEPGSARERHPVAAVIDDAEGY